MRRGLLHLAVALGAGIPLVQFLLRRAPMQVSQRWDGTPVLCRVNKVYKEADACRVGSLLLDAGADVNAESDHKARKWSCCWTAAAHGVQFQDWRFLKLCLDRGSTLEIGTSGGHHRTLVHLALREAFMIEYRPRAVIDRLRKRTAEFIGLLLSHPASRGTDVVNRPDFAGMTPLMLATIWALPRCVAVLLDNGADVNHQWRGRSYSDLIDACYTPRAPLDFVVADDQYKESTTVHVEECAVYPRKQSEYFSCLDEICHLILHRISPNGEPGSAAARNTSLPLRLQASKLQL